MVRRHVRRPNLPASCAFVGFRFPPEFIVLAVRWYLRYGLSYRDLEELLTERGVEVDHVTVYRWVQRFTPLLVEAARPCRHAVGGRWFVEETYVKVSGRWRYVYRAVDQRGQIIDVYVSIRRDLRAAQRFFTTARGAHGTPVEVVTDRAPALARAIEELMPGAFHNTEQYANNRIEADHGRLQVTTAADARAQTRPDRQRDHSRARSDAEHPTRALRTRSRRPHPSSSPGRVHRTRSSNLTEQKGEQRSRAV
jgi:transposase, IS6 family